MGPFTSAEIAFVEGIMEKVNEKVVNEMDVYDAEVAIIRKVLERIEVQVNNFDFVHRTADIAVIRLVCILIMKTYDDLHL